MAQAIAQIKPIQRAVELPTRSAPRILSSREKAAIIVRLLVAEGTSLPLSGLPEHVQAALTEQIGQMRAVDRVTLGAVVEEFMSELEEVGLSFPGGIEGALSIMDGHICPTAASRLRRLAGASAKADPWERIIGLPHERLMPVLEEESTEIGAVMLSKLPVPKAAELLGRLPGERARRVAYAMSLTGNVDPETVRRIGISLASQLDAHPPKAFDADPVDRVGAILNVSSAQTRDDVLLGLEESDPTFAGDVRRAIFTFSDIPSRISGRDVPRIARVVEQPVLITALAGGDTNCTEFILSNMSQRLALSLREEMAERGKVKPKDAEEAQAAVVTAIRRLESMGELKLVREDE